MALCTKTSMTAVSIERTVQFPILNIRASTHQERQNGDVAYFEESEGGHYKIHSNLIKKNKRIIAPTAFWGKKRL